MAVFYQIAIALYGALIRMAAPFNSKAKEWVGGRKDWKARYAGSLAPDDKLVWFHAASLGEFEQGRPVIEAFRKSNPGFRVLLTFFSPSGYLQQKDYAGADLVMYLPADSRSNARDFVACFKPDLAVFIKYEFWFNYLSELKKNNVPTVFISALFRNDQLFFRWYGAWFMKKIRAVDHFFVQDDASAALLKEHGIEQVSVSGDTRFDRVAGILDKQKENKKIEAFCQGSTILLAGSTWPPDEALIAGLTGVHPGLKIIIAPHEVKEERIRQLMKTLGRPAARYSKDDPATWQEKDVLIVDTIGLLSSIYRYAHIAYIGGAFASGLHNIQEPAVNGIPVIFGPDYHKFREAIELVEGEGAFSVSSEKEFMQLMEELLSNKEKYEAACEHNRQYMIANTGASKKILEGLARLL